IVMPPRLCRISPAVWRDRVTTLTVERCTPSISARNSWVSGRVSRPTRSGMPHLVQALDGNARGGAWHLHDIAPKGFVRDEGTQQAQHALAPEHRNLDAAAILQD